MIRSRFQGMYWCAHKTATLTSIQHIVLRRFPSRWLLLRWFLLRWFLAVQFPPTQFPLMWCLSYSLVSDQTFSFVESMNQNPLNAGTRCTFIFAFTTWNFITNLVPLVNFSSSFRFRVRQSCAAVSLRLSQSKPACARLSAWRRHSCRTAATGPLAPRFGARSAAAAAGMLSCWVLSSHLLFLQCGAQCARGEPRSLQQPRYAAPASPRCSSVQCRPLHGTMPVHNGRFWQPFLLSCCVVMLAA